MLITHHSLLITQKLITHCSLLISQRHEFNPNVVAIADRILITVWMISFQVSLFFIGCKRPPLPPFGASDLRRAGDCAPLTATQIDI